MAHYSSACPHFQQNAYFSLDHRSTFRTRSGPRSASFFAVTTGSAPASFFVFDDGGWTTGGCTGGATVFFGCGLIDFENSGRDESSSHSPEFDYKRRLNDLHVACIRIGTVIVILVELVEVALGGKLWRSR